MSYVGHEYTSAEDAMIRSRMAPDAIIGGELGLGVDAIDKRRRRLRGRTIERPEIKPPTRSELVAVATEEVEALQWRVRDAENTLRELGRMLERAEMRLGRLL